MPKQVAYYKCLVISPSDVGDARDAAVAALADWNAHAGESLGVKIEPVRWESHARPEMGGGPQDIINKQLVDDCDFGIAVFWSRLGSATVKHASGSIEEIERLLTKGSNVMVYFCNAPIPQEALTDDQYKRLQEIKRLYRKQGLLAEYSTIEELRRILPLHINGLINSLIIQDRAAGQPIPSQGTATAPMPDVRVTVAASILSREDSMTAGIVVEVQNHSPNDFFFSSLQFQRSDRDLLFFQRNFVTGECLMPRRIEPGDSFMFIIDPTEFIEALEGQQPLFVIAKDKIDRRFQSREGELATALHNALELMKDFRNKPT